MFNGIIINITKRVPSFSFALGPKILRTGPARLPHVQSTVEPGLTHKATGPVYGWGRGSGVFLACCDKVILPLKQCRGGGLTPRRSSFFKKKTQKITR